MEINGKTILYGTIILLIIGLLLFSFKIIFSTPKNQDSDQVSYSDIPNKCRPPKGESISSWKDHLSHHAETRRCLQYFN